MIDAMQVKASRKTGLFVCKAWIMSRHSIYNGSKGGVCLTLAHTLPPSVLNARKGTPYNKCDSSRAAAGDWRCSSLSSRATALAHGGCIAWHSMYKAVKDLKAEDTILHGCNGQGSCAQREKVVCGTRSHALRWSVERKWTRR